jgi:hypothetical protein
MKNLEERNSTKVCFAIATSIAAFNPSTSQLTAFYISDKIFFEPITEHNPQEGISKLFRKIDRSAPTRDFDDTILGAVRNRTAGDLSRNYWKNLPKMADYYDLSEIDDSELVQDALFQAMQKQGW